MFRIRTLLAGLSLIAIGCGASKPVSCVAPAEAHVKVVTYNVNWLCSRPTAVCDYLASSSAKVTKVQASDHEPVEAIFTLK